MQLLEHRLYPCRQVASPNFDERPDAEDIALIVVHCISLPPQEFGTPYIDQLFCNRLNPADHPYFERIYQLKVSAHGLIRRSGEVVQYVPFNLRAWHAGLSEYQGRPKCNDFSIGLELEGTETMAYTDQQYEQLITVINCLLTHYPKLSKQTITGHSNIAPGRKTDPGPSFDWPRLLKGLSNGKSNNTLSVTAHPL